MSAGTPLPVSESWSEEVLDELLPGDLDWRRLTRQYPTASLGLAAAGGFALAWTRGPAVVAALSAVVAGQVARNVESVLGGAGSADAD